MRFDTTAAPHAPPVTSIPVVMRRVLYALIPGILAHVWFFGAGLLINLVIACAAGLAAEGLCLRLRNQPVRSFLSDSSVLVTAFLLAFCIPPLAPWWLITVGMFAAVVLAKHAYGGLGFNPFNPAMVGYVFLLISFPLEMTAWLPPEIGDLDYQAPGFLATLIYSLTGELPAGLSFDAITRATPLDMMGGTNTMAEVTASPLFGDFGGRGWEWINAWIGLGGLYMIYRGVIRWQIPTAMLTTIFLFATVMYFLDADRFPSPLFHLLSGATLIGAFFIATDPVSAATSDSGRLVYGFGIGLLTYIIRTWGGYPDGVAFAVLFMNLTVPVIDRYSRPRVYGKHR